MKALLKTLIGGAVGIGALYVVGKVCFNAGKEYSEIERQLKENKPAPEQPEYDEEDVSNPINGPLPTDIPETVEPETEEEPKRSSFVSKLKNAKMFMAVKKAFSKEGRSPGILGSLLQNPDGARIEAYVRNGGVQINVKPRTA